MVLPKQEKQMFELTFFGITLWSLALWAITIGVLTAITVWEKPISGLVFFIAAFAGISYLNGVNPATWLATNGGSMVGYLIGYLLLGIAFAYAKWTWFYLPSEAVQAKIADAFKYFKRELPSGVTHTEDEVIELFEKSSNYPFGLRKDKWRIATWALWWPLNLLWTLLDDVLLGLVNWMGNVLSGSFAAIARGQVRKTLKTVK